MGQRISLILFIVILACFCNDLNSQTKKQHDKLMGISQKSTVEFYQRKVAAEIFAELKKFPAMKTTLKGDFIELQGIFNGRPMFKTTTNINSAYTICTDRLWENGTSGFDLNGASQRIAIWDGGRVRAEHQEFTNNRVTQKDDAVTNHIHATHVAGTLVANGVDPDAKGMAYQASLDAYDWNNDIAEMAEAAANGIKVSNHSYGFITGWYYDYLGDGKWVWFGDPTVDNSNCYEFGYYSSHSQDFDKVAYNAPNYLICNSAGNNRNDGPDTQPVEHWVWDNVSSQYILSKEIRKDTKNDDQYDCISHAALAKNILSIGAVERIYTPYSSPEDVVMSDFSSWGPTDDGRIKPDVVADGVGLYSCSNASNSSYVVFSGTSMASPSVAGSIALLLEQQERLYGSNELLSSTVKGLLIQTAQEAGQADGPDYSFGWGLVNFNNAVNLLTKNADYNLPFSIQEAELQNGSTFEIKGYAKKNVPVKATICWTDLPGEILTPAANSREKVLVNDLDLRLYQYANNSTELPWILNPEYPANPATKNDNLVDNVEQVEIKNPEGGLIAIRVSNKGILEGFYQDFSVVFEGIEPIIAPELVSPSNNAKDLNIFPFVKLFWNKIETANNYTLQVSKSSDFSTIDFEYKNLTDTTFDFHPDSPIQSYYWRVSAINDIAQSGYSDTWSFQTFAPEVKLNAPENNFVPTSIEPTLSWFKINGIKNYRIQISNSLDFSVVLKDYLTTNDSLYQTEKLEYYTQYFWRVRIENSNNYGPWSEIWNFTTTPDKPVITYLSPSINTCEAVDTSISVVAAGKVVQYQWIKDDVEIINANKSHYIFYKLKYEQAGNYKCKITNLPGNDVIYSDEIIVTPITKTEIVSQPTSVSINEKGNIEITFTAHTLGMNEEYQPEIQWYRANNPLVDDLSVNGRITGTKSNVLSIRNIQKSDYGNDYWFIVTGLCGSDTSSFIEIKEAYSGIQILEQPESINICENNDVSFKVDAIPTGLGETLSYKWYFNNSLISDDTRINGSNTNELSINSIVPTDSGNYRVEITVQPGDVVVYSDFAKLSIDLAPRLTNSFEDEYSVNENETMQFAVEVIGKEPFTFEWFKNGNEDLAESSATLTLANIKQSDEAYYVCRISNECGWAFSESFTLVVNTKYISNIIDENQNSIKLRNNPNPFSDNTTIYFNLLDNQNVRITINDIYGRQIANVYDKYSNKGLNKVSINANELNLSSGIYYYSIILDNKKYTNSMIYIK